MQLLFTSLPTLTVSILYCAWNAYRGSRLQREHKLRERVAVEHTLAHVGQWQGDCARYLGVRKNLFDLRRCAVVHNLHVLARSQALSAELQAAA